MIEVENKLLQAVQASGVVEHETFVGSLDHRECLNLLPTVRDMEKRGLIRRDISEKRDNRRVLKYVRVTT